MRYAFLFFMGILCFSCNAATARTLTVISTAYCSCKLCCGKSPSHPAYGITASGKKASWGTVAVDPKVIPIGSKLRIEGFGNMIFRAEDTGGAIKDNKIDLWYESHFRAKTFGKKKLIVTIIKYDNRIENLQLTTRKEHPTIHTNK